MSTNATLWRPRQEGHHECKFNLCYAVSSRTAWTTYTTRPCLKRNFLAKKYSHLPGAQDDKDANKNKLPVLHESRGKAVLSTLKDPGMGPAILTCLHTADRQRTGHMPAQQPESQCPPTPGAGFVPLRHATQRSPSYFHVTFKTADTFFLKDGLLKITFT